MLWRCFCLMTVFLLDCRLSLKWNHAWSLFLYRLVHRCMSLTSSLYDVQEKHTVVNMKNWYAWRTTILMDQIIRNLFSNPQRWQRFFRCLLCLRDGVISRKEPKTRAAQLQNLCIFKTTKKKKPYNLKLYCVNGDVFDSITLNREKNWVKHATCHTIFTFFK